jgi:hypothetical protein
MDVAILHPDLSNLPSCMVLEENIVGQNHPSAPARLQYVNDVLYEIELLVRCLDGEIVPVWAFPAPFGSKRRIRENAVEMFARVWPLGKRIAVMNLRLDLM